LSNARAGRASGLAEGAGLGSEIRG